MRFLILSVLILPLFMSCGNESGEKETENEVSVNENPFPNPPTWGVSCGCFLDQEGNKADGTYTLYHDNGEVSSITTYVDGMYTELFWYWEDGTLKRYEKGNEILKVYFPNGQIEQHSIHLNGEWHSGDTSWYENGQIREVKMWDEGELLWLKEYDDQGNLTRSDEF